MTRKSVEKYIFDTYGCMPEYLWTKYPEYAVYRHNDNRKWFAIIMNVQKSKIGINSDKNVDIINVKCNPILIGSLLNNKGFYPAYHMNKSYWISISLDGSTDDEQVKWLIDMSFDLTKNKR